jgi:hypothetical protein
MGKAFDPTAEQLAARSAASSLDRGEILAINAYAGTGKTTTNRFIADAVPQWRVLYICYNKEMADAASALMPRHVLCKTVHALAYSGIGYRYKRKLARGLNAREVMDALHCPSSDARIALATLSQFLCSDDSCITLDHVLTVCGERDSSILKLATTLWRRMCDERDHLPMLHDGYLKLWVMGAPDLSIYDLVLVDESQDLNPVILQLVLHAVEQGCRAMFTGDTHQSLYGYRLAIDAMPTVTKLASQKLTLTESWRFPQRVADSASKLLATFKKDRVQLVGRGSGQIDNQTPGHCTIARTNACLIQAAEAAARSACKIHFAATRAADRYDPYGPYRFQEILDVYALYSCSGRPSSSLLNRFKDYDELVTFARGGAAEVEGEPNTDAPDADPELSPLLNFVEQYRHETPSILRTLTSLSVGPDQTDHHFSTAHRSKGKEWNEVTLLDDFVPLDDPLKLAKWKDQHSLREFFEAINVLYVGSTRGRCGFQAPASSAIFFSTPMPVTQISTTTRRHEPRYL